MSKVIVAVVALVVGLAAGRLMGGGTTPAGGADEAASASGGFAAVPGEIGGQDLFGPYDVVANWPKGVETLPGHEKWTSGAAQGIFAENPNRVYLVARGELPHFPKVPNAKLTALGPSLQFPIGGLPWRALPWRGSAAIGCGSAPRRG